MQSVPVVLLVAAKSVAAAMVTTMATAVAAVAIAAPTTAAVAVAVAAAAAAAAAVTVAAVVAIVAVRVVSDITESTPKVYRWKGNRIVSQQKAYHQCHRIVNSKLPIWSLNFDLWTAS